MRVWDQRQLIACAVLFVLLVGATSVATALGGLGAESDGSTDAEEVDAWVPGEEFVELRTESSATFAGPAPGVYRTEVHSTDRFYRDDVSGELIEWDASLASVDGGWSVVSAPSDLVVPEVYGGEEAAVSLRVGDDLVTMGFVGAFVAAADDSGLVDAGDGDTGEGSGLDEPESGGGEPGAEESDDDCVEGCIDEAPPVEEPALLVPDDAVATSGVLADGVVRYSSVVQGVDVWVEPTRRGVKETLVLSDVEAPRVFDFWVSTDLVPELRGAGVVLLDGEGVPVALIPGPYLEDSSLDASAAGFSEAASWALTDRSSGRFGLRLTVEDEWLDDPERVWPVYLDPSVEPINPDSDDTYIYFGASGNVDRSGETVLKAGAYLVGFRAFIHLSGTEEPNGEFALEDKFIWNATLHLMQTHHSGLVSCQEAPAMDVRLITTPWAGEEIMNWNTNDPPQNDQPSYPTVVSEVTRECGQDVWVSADLTGAAQGWADEPEDNFGVALREPVSGPSASFREFKSRNASQDNPYLEVSWSDNEAPIELGDLSLPGGMSGDMEQCVNEALWELPIDSGTSYRLVPAAPLLRAAMQCWITRDIAPTFSDHVVEFDGDASVSEECFAAEYAALGLEEREQLVIAGIDPATASDSTVQGYLLEIYEVCDEMLTPPTLP